MLHYLGLYRYFVIQRFKILMEYRLNFFIGSVSTMILQVASLAAIWVVMRQIPSLNGWSFYEVILIYGLLTMGESITCTCSPTTSRAHSTIQHPIYTGRTIIL